MYRPEAFWMQAPSDGRMFTVGMRVHLRKNGDGDTVIPDPDGDFVILACETGLFGSTRASHALHLTRYLGD